LTGKKFMVGNRFTMADIYAFAVLQSAFAFVLDGGVRKAFPEISAWFARVADQSAILNVMGQAKMCERVSSHKIHQKCNLLKLLRLPYQPNKSLRRRKRLMMMMSLIHSLMRKKTRKQKRPRWLV